MGPLSRTGTQTAGYGTSIQNWYSDCWLWDLYPELVLRLLVMGPLSRTGTQTAGCGTSIQNWYSDCWLWDLYPELVLRLLVMGPLSRTGTQTAGCGTFIQYIYIQLSQSTGSVDRAGRYWIITGDTILT